MFTQGFEKLAWNPMTGVGQAAKGVSQAGKALGEGAKNLLAGGKASRIEGFTGKSVGAKLNVTRARQAGETGKAIRPAADTRRDVAKRMGRMQSYKSMSEAKNKPSFARKHPFITAGALYLGARSAFGGGGEKKKEEGGQAQFIPPQY